MNKAYEQEIEMWNQVFKECTPVDLRKLDLKVETMFDEALKLFAEKTTNVLDFGCGTGDISTHKVLGIDASKVGIQFANETAKLSEYKTATFLEGGEHMISFRQFAFFLCFCYTFVRKEKEKNLENEMNFLTVISNRSKSRKNLSRSRKK